MKCFITPCTRKTSKVAFQTLRFEKEREKVRENEMFDNVISSKKAPLGWIQRNFRLRMRAPFQGNPFMVTWPSVTSGIHVWNRLCMRMRALPVRAASGDVTSGNTPWQHPLKYGLNRTDILLISYTTLNVRKLNHMIEIVTQNYLTEKVK